MQHERCLGMHETCLFGSDDSSYEYDAYIRPEQRGPCSRQEQLQVSTPGFLVPPRRSRDTSTCLNTCLRVDVQLTYEMVHVRSASIWTGLCPLHRMRSWLEERNCSLPSPVLSRRLSWPSLHLSSYSTIDWFPLFRPVSGGVENLIYEWRFW
jgi:hypothetical protein